ncbi:MAG TPA: hypothetical protein VFM96_05840 [Gaiellaceae bacterium]|nr:hypothetical protein [Gaiellaceae bacterium]
MKRLLFIAALAVSGVIPAAAGAGTATFKGVVVGHLRGAVLVSPSSGLIRAFSGSEAVGSRVEFVGGKLVVVGRSHTALVRGIVVRRVGTTIFLSSNRHLVAIHTGRRLASASDTTPSPTTQTTPTTGDNVAAQVTVGNNGQLDEQSEDDLGPSNDSAIQVQAVVAAVGTGTVTLTVNGQTLVVPLPAGLTLPSSFVGQTVTLNLSLNDQNNQGDDNDDQGDSSDDTTSGGGGD